MSWGHCLPCFSGFFVCLSACLFQPSPPDIFTSGPWLSGGFSQSGCLIFCYTPSIKGIIIWVSSQESEQKLLKYSLRANPGPDQCYQRDGGEEDPEWEISGTTVAELV